MSIMDKIKNNKSRKHNQGNSFIMVVATLSFLAVLVAALLVAVALCYRLKAYDINARDNFYYLEQAMDEIYAGVGADAMRHLNEAYDDTIEVLVYFDPATQSYVTMKNDDANTILKNTYIKLVHDDVNYTNANVSAHLLSFISNPYDASSNTEGIQLSVGEPSSDVDSLTINNLVLKREASYSTVNTRKNNAAQSDMFVQTITTDLTISKPEFDVNFNTINSDLNDVYAFSLIADKGIEITGPSTKVNVTGNVYAAADFYNKVYNDDNNTKVSSYSDNEDRYKACNGLDEKSMYSGIYIDGSDVFIASDLLVVPGTIAAFNGADLTISGANMETANASDLWADGIVLGGYSYLKNPTSANSEVAGASVNVRARAYISDDLELNAKGSKFSMAGQYYGYNYASTDNRTYTAACLQANGSRSAGRTFSSSTNAGIKNGSSIAGQAHYNSSAIIVNGEDSLLDLSSVSDLYIAGQAYIETSKTTTSNAKSSTATKNFYQYEDTKPSDADEKEDPNYNYKVVKNADNSVAVATYTEENTYDTYSYPDQDNKNYTTNTKDYSDDSKNTMIQDYRTGEAISVKTNQLAYLPPEDVVDNGTELYFKLPARLENIDLYKKYFDDISKIPVIKTVVSGKVYYYLDFSTEATTNAGINTDVMNQFIEDYANMFKLKTGQTKSDGENYGLTDITNYDYFKIKMIKVNTTYDKDTGEPDTVTTASGDTYFEHIYTNSAITVKNKINFTVKAKSNSVAPLVQAAKNLNENFNQQRARITDTTAQGNILGNIDTNIDSSNASTTANSITTRLQSQYKEVKWMLTTKTNDATGLADSHSMAEDSITPINYFFEFNKIGASGWSDVSYKLNSGYKVWVSKDDVAVDTTGFPDGNVKGFIMCKGDVTFDPAVKSFEGIIVCGSKIKIDHTMNVSANEEICKTVLRECDEAQNNASTAELFTKVCGIVKKYQSVYQAPAGGSGSAVATETLKSISAVQFEDILGFNNWKKNVD